MKAGYRITVLPKDKTDRTILFDITDHFPTYSKPQAEALKASVQRTLPANQVVMYRV